MPLSLPDLTLELVKHIACQLETVREVLSFSLVCRQSSAAVSCDHVVFQSLFLRLYEKPRNPEGYDYKAALRRRHSKVLDNHVVRDMLLDARPARKSLSAVATSPNIEYLAKVFTHQNPPLDLRGLLYPLQFLSRDASLFDLINPADTEYTRAILQNFPKETDKIAHTFAERLHLSNLKHSCFSPQLPLLDHSEFPNFWTGDLWSQGGGAGTLPKRWFGAYLYIPLIYNTVVGRQLLALTEMTLNFSQKGIFSSRGHDIADYTIRDGKIAVAGPDGRRRVSWIKDYGRLQWRYEGMLEVSSQRIVGVWGKPGWFGKYSRFEGYGIFMLWAVPEGTMDLNARG